MTDAVVVGSGPNGLAAALTLAASGVRVRVIEAEETLGGGIRSSALTDAGLIHDECAGFHPLAVDSPFARRFDLVGAGLRWRWAPAEYAHPLADGAGATARRSVEETAAGLGAAGAAWRLIFEPMVRAFDALSEDLLQPVVHRPRHPLLLARFGARAALPARVLGAGLGAGPGAGPGNVAARALFAGVAAHAVRPFDQVLSSAVGVALACAAHRYGWPVAEGGSASIRDAVLVRAAEHGVAFETGRWVRSLDELGPVDVVMLDVAPRAAAAIVGDRLPRRVARAYGRYRHGPGAFKVDFAVAEGVPWRFPGAREAATIHLGGTLDEVARSEREVCAGRMPAEPFVLVGQQFLADPTRSRGDLHPVYAYAHVPAGYRGDATAAITDRIERFAPGFRERVQAVHVRTTAQIEEGNANYVGGDILTGANDPWQILFSPRPSLDPYATGVDGVYLCSAATPPGAGAHGMCGFNAARRALRALERA